MLRHKYFLLLPFFSFSSCLFYSLSGSSLNKECKTFSLGQITIETANTPHNITEIIKDRLRCKMKDEMGLQEVDSDGDVCFDCAITDYTMDTISGSDKVKVTIKMEVSYKNRYDQEKQFIKKDFSKDIEIPHSEAHDDNSFTKKILDELIEDICNKSTNAWD